MTILLMQTFLLLLGAFLLGAALACFVRRAFAGRAVADDALLAGSAAALTGIAVPGDSGRFGRALTGGAGLAPLEPTGPVVEVQPRPPVRVTPLIETVEPPVTAEAPPPEPEPEPVSEPAAPLPSAAPEPEEPSPGESYRQVAFAAAAGAAAAAAAGAFSRGAEAEAEAEAEGAELRDAEETAAAEAEPDIAELEPAADDTAGAGEFDERAATRESVGADDPIDDDADDDASVSDDERSYTEIAVQAAGLAAAAAAATSSDDDSERGETDAAAPDATEDATGGDAGGVVAASASEVGDDFTRIHTIDAALRNRLHGLGMTRFADIGGWSATDVLRFTQTLGVAPGRIEQENWAGQAQVLAAGGVTDYPRWRAEDGTPRAAQASDGELLSRIIGIDPESERVLRDNGVATLGDIAAWSDDDVASFEQLLNAPGRIGRENWVEQARFLMRGSTNVASAIEDIAAPVVGAAAAALAAAGALASGDASSDTEPVEDASDAPEEATATETPDEDGAPPPAAAAGSRVEGYTGLRSVRSEALVGDLSLPPGGSVDDLKRIRGIGVLIEKRLQSLGITSYEQVANWTGDDVARISDLLDFKGRIERENWIEQARILASGGQTEFSRRVDRGEA